MCSEQGDIAGKGTRIFSTIFEDPKPVNAVGDVPIGITG